MALAPKFDLVATVNAAIKNGDHVAAESAVRDALAATPQDIKALEGLVWLQSAQADYAGLHDSLERLDLLAPGQANVLLSLSKIKRAFGDDEGAVALLRRARAQHPRNAEVVVALANSGNEIDGIAELRAFITQAAEEPRVAADAFAALIVLQERKARIGLGKSPKFTGSWGEALGWTDQQGLLEFQEMLLREATSPRVHADAVVQLGAVAAARQDWASAEDYFARLRRHVTKRIWDIVNFDQKSWAAHESQSLPDILRGLPPVEFIREYANAAAAPHTLMLACDPIYFRQFVLPLLESLGRLAPHMHVHAHLLDGDTAEWADLAALGVVTFGDRLTLTAERSGVRARGPKKAGDYYHAIRFVRFYEFMKTAKRPYWMMDVDAEFRADPTPQFMCLPGADVALWAQAGILEPWSKFAAGIAGGAGTDGSLEFFGLVAANIASIWRDDRLRWGADQQSLFGAAVHLARSRRLPSACFLDEQLISHNASSPDAPINFTSGMKKYTALGAE